MRPLPWSHGFSLSTFLSTWLLFAAVPTVVLAGVLFYSQRGQLAKKRRGRGLGLWATGLLGAVTSFLGIAGWLSWTASNHAGEFVGPGWPVPNSFPLWQIVSCGLTLFGLFIFTVFRSRYLLMGAFAAALGSVHGVTTAMIVASSYEVTSQEGIGVFLMGICSTAIYGALVPAVAAWKAGRRVLH